MKRLSPWLAFAGGIIVLALVIPLFLPAQPHEVRVTRPDAQRIADEAAAQLGVAPHKLWSAMTWRTSAMLDTELERDIVEAEAAVREFAEQHEQASVSVMRFCNVLGPDITTSHASGEEAVGAIFDRSRGNAKWDKDTDEGPSDRSNKKKSQKGPGGSLVAATERKAGRASTEGTPDHFDKLL